VSALPATVTVPARFNGPPESANGGYAAGLLGRHVAGAAEVTLWAPPLERPLAMTRDGDTLAMWDGATLVAEAVPTTVEAEPPAVVPLEAAEAATAGYPGFAEHAFPTCVVCGPQRDVGDGLRVFPGPVPETPVFAAPWVPDGALADADGVVAPEIVWAVLDCPSAFGGVRRCWGASPPTSAPPSPPASPTWCSVGPAAPRGASTTPARRSPGPTARSSPWRPRPGSSPARPAPPERPAVPGRRPDDQRVIVSRSPVGPS
jgi:hypothetical protein